MKSNRITSAGHSSNTIVSRSQFKPILFSTAMVEAIMSGNKTQTRRKVPAKVVDAYYDYDDWASSVGKPEGVPCTRTYDKEYFMDRCKYSVGDILWVRETWQVTDFLHIEDENWGYIYKASENGRDWESNDDNWKWKPSIFMPKQACRLFLEVTDVRAERLQDISDDDCIAEGIKLIDIEEPYTYGYELHGNHSLTDILGRKAVVGTENESYATLWQHINGNWDENPYVWVITFKLVERPQGFC